MKLPAKLQKAERCDLANLSIFTDNVLTAMAVAIKVAAKKRYPICGYVVHDGKRVYWIRYGFVNSPAAYATPRTKRHPKPSALRP